MNCVTAAIVKITIKMKPNLNQHRDGKWRSMIQCMPRFKKRGNGRIKTALMAIRTGAMYQDTTYSAPIL